jgi:hypothetical protein
VQDLAELVGEERYLVGCRICLALPTHYRQFASTEAST